MGINAKSVECMWEQHDQTNTYVSAEVLPILAEDASYKLWELANVSSFDSNLVMQIGTLLIFGLQNLKTFTRHSGGKLTADIVNEVLKDCNVPPVIGARAGNSAWNRVDYDGTFHYHAVRDFHKQLVKHYELHCKLRNINRIFYIVG